MPNSCPAAAGWANSHSVRFKGIEARVWDFGVVFVLEKGHKRPVLGIFELFCRISHCFSINLLSEGQEGNMALVIRLKRGGMKHAPVYQIVAAEKRMPRDGRFLEKFGTYFPEEKEKDKALTVDREKLQVWLSKGATPSLRVKALLQLK